MATLLSIMLDDEPDWYCRFWLILKGVNPLIPNSDKNEISVYITTARSNSQVMRIKETITKDKILDI